MERSLMLYSLVHTILGINLLGKLCLKASDLSLYFISLTLNSILSGEM